MGNRIKAAGYVRVSSLGQVKDKISLSVQRDAITKFVEAHEDYTLTKIYEDEGISGGTVKNVIR